jgi:hypothetical protein
VDVELAPAAGIEAPGDPAAPLALSLVRTCSDRDARWYLVPLAVTKKDDAAPAYFGPDSAADAAGAIPAARDPAEPDPAAKLDPAVPEAAELDSVCGALPSASVKPRPARSRQTTSEPTATTGRRRKSLRDRPPPPCLLTLCLLTLCLLTRARAGAGPSAREPAASAASAALIRVSTASGRTGTGTEAR